jgi:hypothetical protein
VANTDDAPPAIIVSADGQPEDYKLPPPAPAYHEEEGGLGGGGQEGNDLLFSSEKSPAYEQSPPKLHRFHGIQLPLRPFTVGFALSTFVMWIFTLVIDIFHRMLFSYSKAYDQALVPLPSVYTHPESLASNMPESCINYIKSGHPSLANQGLFLQEDDRTIAGYLENMQFIFLSIIGVIYCWNTYTNKRSPFEPEQTAKTMKAIAVCASGLMFFVIIISVVYVNASVFARHQAVNVAFTHNATNTGNCTFATVGLDKRFGYFDVKEGLGLRIAQNVLGISS